MDKKYIELLKEFAAFKSISTSAKYKDDCKKCAEWMKTQFAENGFEVEVIEGYGNPLVLASYEVEDESAETVLIYGHYDVQPAEKGDGWDSEPFELTEKDERFYARGVMDDKGLVLIHMWTLFELLKSGKLKYNVKFLVEGDEETGSVGVTKFIEEYKDKLDSDFVLVSDGPQFENRPTLEVGYRGTFNLTLKLKTLDNDVHSGQYGGVTPNAAYELSHLLAHLMDGDKLNIPEVYEGLPGKEKVAKMTKDFDFDAKSYSEKTGAKMVFWEEGLNYFAQKGLRPAVEITGLNSGYVGEGYRNSIPAEATAKINFRLAEGQSVVKTIEGFRRFVEKYLPEYVQYEIETTAEPISGYSVDTDNKYFSATEKLLEKVYGGKVFKNYVGGTIPIIRNFMDILDVPTVSVPLANADSGMHSVNENLTFEKVEKGLEFSEKFFS
ncbi:M20/M25/M40 family metallo-hydrolase [Candidatus Dojkabacteria bacterium]|nr:M20/M25/M40 family metallo-hydrolase [Candidatus Dojkabacteria bacterium]